MSTIIFNGRNEENHKTAISDLFDSTEGEVKIAVGFASYPGIRFLDNKSGDRKTRLIIGDLGQLRQDDMKADENGKVYFPHLSNPNLEIRHLENEIPTRGRLHAKVYLFENSGMITSANLSIRGLQHSREIGAVYGYRQDVIHEEFEKWWEVASGNIDVDYKPVNFLFPQYWDDGYVGEYSEQALGKTTRLIGAVWRRPTQRGFEMLRGDNGEFTYVQLDHRKHHKLHKELKLKNILGISGRWSPDQKIFFLQEFFFSYCGKNWRHPEGYLDCRPCRRTFGYLNHRLGRLKHNGNCNLNKVGELVAILEVGGNPQLYKQSTGSKRAMQELLNKLYDPGV